MAEYLKLLTLGSVTVKFLEENAERRKAPGRLSDNGSVDHKPSLSGNGRANGREKTDRKATISAAGTSDSLRDNRTCRCGGCRGRGPRRPPGQGAAVGRCHGAPVSPAALRAPGAADDAHMTRPRHASSHHAPGASTFHLCEKK